MLLAVKRSALIAAGAPYIPELMVIEKWGSKDAPEPFGHKGLERTDIRC